MTTLAGSPRLPTRAIVALETFNTLAVAPRIEELTPHGFAPGESEPARAVAGDLDG